MSAYYHFIKREQQEDGVSVAHYQPTKHAQGAWNEHEQHMAPATGLLTAELNGYAPQENMRIARISLDILGLIPLDDFTITTRCIRPGRTIELVEAVMSSRGRDAIIARAWRLMTQDTSEIAGLEDQKSIHKPEGLSSWEGMKGWPGGFIESVRLVAAPDRRPGRGMVFRSCHAQYINRAELARRGRSLLRHQSAIMHCALLVFFLGSICDFVPKPYERRIDYLESLL